MFCGAGSTDDHGARAPAGNNDYRALNTHLEMVICGRDGSQWTALCAENKRARIG
jgi:hypothetical protein